MINESVGDKVMVKKYTEYACDLCSYVYSEEDDAIKCEKTCAKLQAKEKEREEKLLSMHRVACVEAMIRFILTCVQCGEEFYEYCGFHSILESEFYTCSHCGAVAKVDEEWICNLMNGP